MNELAINIEYLLLSHNCVTVPTLGTFHTMHTPARWIHGESLFLPPVRNVHFDSAIQTDPDEIFLQSLATVYNLTAAESLERCEQMVAEFHKQLVTEGTVDFGSIGVFTLEDDAEITMASCECGVITPAYYGLDALHMDRIQQKEETPTLASYITLETSKVAHSNKGDNSLNNALSLNEAPIEINAQPATSAYGDATEAPFQIPLPQEADSDTTHVTFKIKKSVLSYAMAVCAALLLFFSLKPTPVFSPAANGKAQASVQSFLQPGMIEERENTDEFYYADTLSEAKDSTFDAVLVDITEEALNEGISLNDDPQEANEPSSALNTTPSEVAHMTVTTTKGGISGERIIQGKGLSSSASTSASAKNTSLAKQSVSAKQTMTVSAKQTVSTYKETMSANKESKAHVAPQPQHRTSLQASASSASQPTYCIVLASLIAKPNAEHFIKRLQQQQIKARLIEKGKMRRVVVDGFRTETDAHNYLNTLQSKNKNIPEVAQAWVLKL